MEYMQAATLPTGDALLEDVLASFVNVGLLTLCLNLCSRLSMSGPLVLQKPHSGA